MGGTAASLITRPAEGGRLGSTRPQARSACATVGTTAVGMWATSSGLSDATYTSPHVYLDIGMWSGESDTFSVYVKRIKVYDSIRVSVTGLEPGWGGRYSGQ